MPTFTYRFFDGGYRRVLDDLDAVLRDEFAAAGGVELTVVAVEVEPEVTAGAVPESLFRAERMIASSFRKPLSIDDLAGEATVSPRTLFNQFREHRGTTPAAALRATRLRAAREELREADGRETTVAKIAMRCGFGHAGRFAANYAELFGEAPSETLRRASDGNG